jgi:hypothetical protein
MGETTLKAVIMAQPQQVIPAWEVRTWDGILYYQCGRCWKREEHTTPTGKPEQRRPLPQGIDKLCVFCQRKAQPYVV